MISEQEKQDYLRNYEGIALRKYEVMKVKPKICEIVDLCQKQQLDTAEYPYVGPAPPYRQIDEERVMKRGQAQEPAQRLIVFVAGGITRTEISCL